MRSSEGIAFVVFMGLAAWNGGAAERPVLDAENFGYDFERSEVDFKNDTAHFFGHVRVTQGPNSIQAEEATARAFRSENKQWEFRDSVLLRTEDARLSAETATAAFDADVLVAARVEGTPAEFERLGESPEQLARGRARVIEYDLVADTVTLTGDVWFGYGKDEFTGETVIYSLRDEFVRLNSGESGRVRGIIRPRTGEKEKEPDRREPNIPRSEGDSSGNEGEA